MIIQEGKTYHLQGKNISYVMMENQEGDLLNFHFGRKIAAGDYAARPQLWAEAYPKLTNTVYLRSYPQEYPSFGHNDTRMPAYQVCNSFGNRISRLKVKCAEIHSGKLMQVEGMPSLFGGGDTLELVLEDAAIGLEVHLYYGVFDDYDVIARHAVICNKSNEKMTLCSAYSANVDLPEAQYDLICFAGEWGRELAMERTHLRRGMRTEVADNTGRGSRECGPFTMVATADADEDRGEVYGFSLIYSGNHSTRVQVDVSGKMRIQQGISPESFAWELQPGECFYTPQSVICYSNCGFGEMSRQYHKVYRSHLMRSTWADKARPVVCNNWEATYFDFNEEKILALASKAKSVGVDLFVLDDGWFGQRNSAQSGLGDWVVNRQKLPSGIEGLAEKLHEMGMQFGLWFEPEMVSPDSQLYRSHPDWVVSVPQMEPVQRRWQLVLDLTKPQVREYIVNAVAAVLNCGKIAYVKWDMNRDVFDVPESGFYHRYVLGYYAVVKRLTEMFPQVLFEGCSSGGGRFDPGVLAYMPQIWTSDNSDAVSRLKIQYSTSMCYPLSAISNHVSAVPNHQVGRITSLKTRADVAYAGVFGYELDLTKLGEDELEQIREQITFAKRIQALIFRGDLYRLRSPYETNECAWSVVSEEKDRVFLMTCRILSVIREQYFEPKVKLMGLDPDGEYENVTTGERYSGSLLMHRGLTVRYPLEDFATCTMEFKKV